MRYLLKTKNAIVHNASRRTITTAAITPPEGREDLFVDAARPESAAGDEVLPPLMGMVVLPEAGPWRAVLDVTAVVVVGDDGDDGDSLMSDKVEIGLATGLERDNPPGIGRVVVKVETPTAMDTFPMLDAGELGPVGVGTGVPVVKRGGSSRSESTALL